MSVSVDWLTKAYLEEALRVHHKDASAKVYQLQVQSALGKGENYGGILMRAKAQYTLNNGKKTLNSAFIVKYAFEESNVFIREKMQPYDIFKREMSIYQNVLPKLCGLLREINDNDKLFPSALHVDYKREVLIFEDLSEQHYVMADRLLGLDMPHVKLILRKVAKMHATSAVLNERENGCLEGYDRGFFNRYTDNYSSYFVDTLLACSRFLQQNMPEYAKYSRKLSKLASHYMEIGKRCFAPTPGHVNVLAHGDLWVNNVMFKYDPRTAEPVDVLLIDFQYSFWGSPALDLHHLFNTSLHEDLRLHKQDILFQYYHSIFTDTLNRLRYSANPVPSLRVFRLHAEEKRFFALHSSCVVQPVMINENTEDADINALLGDDERATNFKYNLYKNVRVQKNLKNLLPLFDQRGLLEVNQCD